MPPSKKRQAAGAGKPAETRQKAKSDATRRRICEAAAGTIAADGYHRTSIINVAGRCGISIGAVQYHYPSKEALVTATAHYLLNRSVKWFARAKADLGGPKKQHWKAFAELIRRSWHEQFTTAEYGALLEILVAARTDKTLHRKVGLALFDWRSAIEDEVRAIFPAEEDANVVVIALTMSRALMTGLLVHDDLIGDDTRIDVVIGEWTKIWAAQEKY